MHLTRIRITEPAGLNRDQEWIGFGLPLPRGLCWEVKELGLRTAQGNTLPAEITALSSWSDSSLRWVYCETLLSLQAKQSMDLDLGIYQDQLDPDAPRLSCSLEKEQILIHTGQSQFCLEKHAILPRAGFKRSMSSLVDCQQPGLVLQDAQEQKWQAVPETWQVLARHELGMRLHSAGEFQSQGQGQGLRFSCKLHFYAGQDVLRLDIGLHNPNPAMHPGNTWDLGDKGSVLFRDMHLGLSLAPGCRQEFFWQPEPTEAVQRGNKRLCVYQDSSGGRNWNSPNHVNRKGQIALSFQGYQVQEAGQVVGYGSRAQPIVGALGSSGAVGMAMPWFWQNFPQAFEANGSTLYCRYFPRQHADLFELQGGEQKTHTLYLALGADPDQVGSVLARARRPLAVVLDPQWLLQCQACPGMQPRPRARALLAEPEGQNDPEKNASNVYTQYERLLQQAVQGDHSFFARREIIDEYGWRNFGDLYADHEAVFHTGEDLFVSHYNNQYDVIKGAMAQFCSTGQQHWLRLATELAEHVADIDIYHTDQDRLQYNHGLFWHTDHHLHAATATHRSISSSHLEYKHHVGGGPAPDHNYATGLALMYWFTGQERYKQAALELASNIVQLVLGPDTLAEAGYGLLKNWLLRLKSKPGLGNPAFEHVYGLLDGPGRASGNALNTLIDAYLLTQEQQYLDLAEYLICCCVSPEDELQGMDLQNPELRWMYTIFIKALSRYIELKHLEEQQDALLAYARAAFMHYAQWMLEQEYPYLDKPEILEFPNETWAAQELRKSDILALAAEMVSAELRNRLMQQSVFFFATGLEHLQRFENQTLTRPLVLLMTNGLEHMRIYEQWQSHQLPAGQDLQSIIQAWEQNPYPLQMPTGYERFKAILQRASLGKELRWLKQRMFFRFSK